MPGFKPSKPVVYASLYPSNQTDFDTLSSAIEKLCLNDTSVQAERETSVALGLGYRCGFLGILHMDVFTIRLEQEYNVQSIITAPNVNYIGIDNKNNITYKIDSTAKYNEYKDINNITYQEPMSHVSIIMPSDYMGDIIELCESHRGVQIDLQQLSSDRILLKYTLPLSEIITDFYDSVKSVTAGYASMDYELTDYQDVDLVCLDIKINGDIVDALSVLCVRGNAVELGRKLADKLATVIDRQSYEVIIQACIGSKVIARSRIAPYRKDVLTKGGKTVGGGGVLMLMLMSM